MPANKDEKRGTWQVRFRYTSWNGETKWASKRGFKTKHDALKWEADFKARIDSSLDMSFAEFVKLYREERYPRLRETTSENKDYVLDKKILPYFGKMKLIDISTSDIVKWQNELLAYKDPVTGKSYSSTYLKTVNNQFSAVMNYAMKYYGLRDNPVKRVGYIGAQNAEEMHFWTTDQYLIFSEEVMCEPLAYYCFEVLYWTGIREGELLALTMEDFDFKKKTITINKSLKPVHGKTIIGPPKTKNSYRTITMPDMLCDEMQDYFRMLYEPDKSERIFPVTKSYLYKHMKKGCERAGIDKIRVHDLRHSHVSLLIHLGFSPVEIAKRVGHESVHITFRYAHMFPSAQQQMADKLSGAMERRTNDKKS